MPSFRLLPLFPILFCSTLVHAADATDWNAAARQDMQFAIDKIRSNHAGAVSGQVEVTDALETGGRIGMVEAAQVHTEVAYRRTMVRFIEGFGDPHTGINLRLNVLGWTGLVLDQVDGAYRVTWSEPGWPNPLPPRGAIVQSCNGVWIGTYLKTRVAPFLNHSPEYPTSASEAARQSMFERGLDWAPASCDFLLQGGATRRVDLPLRPVASGVGEARLAQVRQQVDAKARPAGLYRLADGTAWVAMPDFNGKTSGAAYEKLYAQLAELKDAKWVVFDLRGNGGGDSTWGNRALQALYGKDYGMRLGDAPTYTKRLIADQATVDLYRRYASLPAFAASRKDFEEIIPKLALAVEHGDKLVVVETGTREGAAAVAAQLRRRPGGPRIAAVIDRGCFSSCMNFIQQIRAIDDTVLLGEPTLGYSPYGEINQLTLPSGHGTIQLAAAIYTSFQAPREPFVPDLRYPGNLADEPALMRWVAATLAQMKPLNTP